jgi:hypothetical protein
LLLSSITPFLLSRVLTAHKLPNAEAAALIEALTHSSPTLVLTAADLVDLNAAVDWEDGDAYRLFSQYALDWVDPSFARRCLSQLRVQRVATLSALSARASGVPAVALSRWFASAWLQEVENSGGSTADPPVELLSYLSALGGSVAFGFLEDISSPSLGAAIGHEDGVGARVLFDIAVAERERGRWHFVSQPCKEPRVGAYCVGFEFRVESVIFEFEQTEQTAYRGPHQLRLDLQREGKTVYSDIREMTRSTVDFNLPIPMNCSSLTITMIGGGNNRVLRADAIRVFGMFDPEVWCQNWRRLHFGTFALKKLE